MPNREFDWDEETIKEFIRWYNNSEEVFYGSDPYQVGMNKFKQSKIKEKERIEVSIGSCAEINKSTYNTVIQTTIPITSELAPSVKNVLEKLLNDEQPKEEIRYVYKDKEVSTIQPQSGEFITKERCDELRREAFNAGRTQVPAESKLHPGNITLEPLWLTFEDFDKSLTKQ